MTARTVLRTTDGPFTIDDYGSNVITVSIDHGISDGKDRRIGGRADIAAGELSGLLLVRIHATRDGVAFGALRRRTSYGTRAEALAAAKAKLTTQGSRYRKDRK